MATTMKCQMCLRRRRATDDDWVEVRQVEQADEIVGHLCPECQGRQGWASAGTFWKPASRAQ
jgi:hypothetical protein